MACAATAVVPPAARGGCAGARSLTAGGEVVGDNSGALLNFEGVHVEGQVARSDDAAA